MRFRSERPKPPYRDRQAGHRSLWDIIRVQQARQQMPDQVACGSGEGRGRTQAGINLA
jgi:hypothetical protein